jgi:hypothetical protein
MRGAMKRTRLVTLALPSVLSILASALAATLVASGGCSPASPRGVIDDTVGGDASVEPAHGDGSVDVANNGTPDASPFDAVSFEVPSRTQDATGDACAATKVTATLIPLDIFIMLDQSSSMNEKTPTSTKWEGVKAAISTFMKSPETAGVGVGIQYFGLPDSIGFGDSCNVADYATADVPIAPLPGVRTAIEASLAAHSPTTITPTAPALQGAIQYAQAWQKANPTHVVIVLLATDGQPTECDVTDIPTIAGYAKAAAVGKPSIRTYVIGVLADKDITRGADTNMNDISKAGNGADAFIIKSATTDVTTAFVTALNKIRGASLACQYAVPTGVGADYKKVNISLGTSGGSSANLPYVGSVAKCNPTTGGWYYDVDPAAGTPTKILMCDASCKSLGASPSATIDIQVGCATEGGPT